MTAAQTAASPALRSGPFNALHSLGVDRGNYIAVHSNNPAAAAQYAVENMGFYLVHADSEGRHYLAAHGLDAYSLVYTPGAGPARSYFLCGPQCGRLARGRKAAH